MLIHSTTKYIKVPDLENLSLMSIALPSISVTMETEYHYSVYIAIEKDDYLGSVQIKLLNDFVSLKS